MGYKIMAHSNSSYSGSRSALLKGDGGHVVVFETEAERDAELDRINKSVRSPFVWYAKA